MKKSKLNLDRRTIDFLSASFCCVQIYGGGVLLVTMLVDQISGAKPAGPVMLILGAGVAFLAMALGAKFLRGKPVGPWCSLLWLAQCPMIMLPHFSYAFFLAGTYVVGIEVSGNPFLDGQLGSAIVLKFAQHWPVAWVGIDLPAAMGALIFWWAHRQAGPVNRAAERRLIVE